MTVCLQNFCKRKDFLLCVDSDGCAMDTMNIKHFRCFGPCFADEWHITEHRDEVLARWNQINLYEMTRGINRFKGLALILQELYSDDADVKAFASWVKDAGALSEGAVANMVVENPVFEKALRWSRAVNRKITQLTDDEKIAFPSVCEALAKVHVQFDIAVVSSANYDAVAEEWERCALLEHVDVVTTQADGSKAHCIAQLLKKGYAPGHAIMVGDAPGDLDAAKENGISFYPILVGKEQASWESLPAFLEKFLNGESEKDEARLREAFYANLNA